MVKTTVKNLTFKTTTTKKQVSINCRYSLWSVAPLYVHAGSQHMVGTSVSTCSLTNMSPLSRQFQVSCYFDQMLTHTSMQGSPPMWALYRRLLTIFLFVNAYISVLQVFSSASIGNSKLWRLVRICMPIALYCSVCLGSPYRQFCILNLSFSVFCRGTVTTVYCIWSPIPFLLYLLFHVSSVPVSYVLQ